MDQDRTREHREDDGRPDLLARARQDRVQVGHPELQRLGVTRRSDQVGDEVNGAPPVVDMRHWSRMIACCVCTYFKISSIDQNETSFIWDLIKLNK